MNNNIDRIVDALIIAKHKTNANIDGIDELINDASEAQTLIRTVPDSDVCLIGSRDLFELLQDALYDTLGRLHKQHKMLNGRNATFEEFLLATWNIYPTVTSRTLQCVYDILTDLWSDNEELGNNHPDGTYSGLGL